MQVNAFGFPLGTSTPSGMPAGAPALGFLQALGVAGAGLPVAPTGGPAVLPVSSLTAGGAQPSDWNLADAGQAMTRPNDVLPSMIVGQPAAPSASALPANGAAPLLPQTNDALAHVAAPTAMPAAPAAPVMDKPILASLQSSTSLSGLLETAARLPKEAVPSSAPAALYSSKPALAQPAAPQPITAQPMVAQPAVPQPVTAQPGVPQPAQPVTAQPVTEQPAHSAPSEPLVKPQPSVACAVAPLTVTLTQASAPAAPLAATPQATLAAALPPSDAAPAQGKPATQLADDGAEQVPTEQAQSLADAAALPPQLQAAQPVPQPVPAQAVAQQTEAQPAPMTQAGSRQPRSVTAQANPAEPTRATRKSANDGTAAPGAVQNQPDAVATDFARAVQATTGNDTGQPQDNAQPRDPQATFAALAQPTHTAPASSSAAPAMPAPQEPVVSTRPGQFGQSMGVAIARTVEAGEETLRVRLNPDNLGRVEVTLAFEDGTLKATVRAESQRALDLLRQDMPDLARSLDQAGVRNDAQSFRFEARTDTGSSPQQGGGQQQRGQNPQQQRHAQADDLEPAPAYRAIRADGQVDLLA